VTTVAGETWFDEPTPIADAVTTGEIPPMVNAAASDLQIILERLDAIDGDLATIIEFLNELRPLLDKAQAYVGGSKLDKARMAMGLKNG